VGDSALSARCRAGRGSSGIRVAAIPPGARKGPRGRPTQVAKWRPDAAAGPGQGRGPSFLRPLAWWGGIRLKGRASLEGHVWLQGAWCPPALPPSRPPHSDGAGANGGRPGLGKRRPGNEGGAGRRSAPELGCGRMMGSGSAAAGSGLSRAPQPKSARDPPSDCPRRARVARNVGPCCDGERPRAYQAQPCGKAQRVPTTRATRETEPGE
jgi:hypothetical protein